MKSVLRILIATLVVGYITDVAAAKAVAWIDEPPIMEPSPSLKKWIEIDWLGPTSHPIIPVFFTDTGIATPKGALFRYVNLSGEEYLSLQRFVYSQRCSTDKIGPAPDGIATRELRDGKWKIICVFPHKTGCEFLFALAGFQKIDWAHKDTWPLTQFEGELGCEGVRTPAHDAHGRPYR